MKFEYSVVPDASPSKPFFKVIEVDPKHLAEVEAAIEAATIVSGRMKMTYVGELPDGLPTAADLDTVAVEVEVKQATE
jgi:hypothetical protein